MPQFPESLDPKGRKSADSRVELEWHTISYRTVAMIALAIAVGAGIVTYIIYPEKVRWLISRVIKPSDGGPRSNVQQRQAQFLNIDGNVRVKKRESLVWVAASPNIGLEKGDQVQAYGDGVARIAFTDGSVYTVRPETLIVVEENSSTLDSKATSVSVQVSTGEVDLSTTKFDGVSRVSFGGGGQALLGQDSRAKVKNDPKTRASEITLAQGSAEVLRGTEKMTLGSYERVAFKHGDPGVIRERVAGPPLLLIPANGAPVIAPDTGKSEVSFSWTPVPTARQYRLRISTSPIFTTLAFDKRIASSSVKVPGLADNTYYWAVSSVDEKNLESQPSDASKFKLQRGGSDEILLELDSFIQHGKSYQIVGRTEPGAKLMVNDEPVFTIQPDGSFKHFTQPFTNQGANQITITAQNAKGQLTTKRKTVYIQ